MVTKIVPGLNDDMHNSVIGEILASMSPPEGSFTIKMFCEKYGLKYNKSDTIRNKFEEAVREGRMLKHGPYPTGRASAYYYSEVDNPQDK